MFLVPLGDFGFDFGAHWILKGPNINRFRIKQHKINTKGVQEGVLKKHDFQTDFDCQNGRPQIANILFPIIPVAIFKVSLDHEI